jgi:hypothetical protein
VGGPDAHAPHILRCAFPEHLFHPVKTTFWLNFELLKGIIWNIMRNYMEY